MRTGRSIIPEPNTLRAIDRLDLELLLNASEDDLLGTIMRLNRTVRYRNSLDAFRLIQQIAELRAQFGRNTRRH